MRPVHQIDRSVAGGKPSPADRGAPKPRYVLPPLEHDGFPLDTYDQRSGIGPRGVVWWIARDRKSATLRFEWSVLEAGKPAVRGEAADPMEAAREARKHLTLECEACARLKPVDEIENVRTTSGECGACLECRTPRRPERMTAAEERDALLASISAAVGKPVSIGEAPVVLAQIAGRLTQAEVRVRELEAEMGVPSW